jgi:DNA-binding transcriptional ArsR family regulator
VVAARASAGNARRRDVQAVFDALAHPRRRQILLILRFRGGRMAAGQIAERFSCAWPTTTRHLHILEAAGLVRVVKKGRERVYRLEARRLRAVAGAWLAWFGARNRSRGATRPGGAVRPVP